ncbi:prion-like-(Q/N-rich) domain-bearing protein 25 [Cotesia glomerata]|uniref:prion-like-(Q/N-rich) domain-bearing protein 25 n=1 Tax=Cotesia glomerata TaxID=32391 RepID=UPI001D01141B|nr:prion-like-(Q/N-rich) domain-bearing protein 25 [Cotesia glomerata]
MVAFLELSSRSSEEECQETEFLLYIQGKCFCPVNHVMVDGRNCLPLLNEICSQNKPCVVHNSDCINGRCKCNPNFVAQSNNRCLPTKLYGKCKNDDDCSYIKNSTCSKYNECVYNINYNIKSFSPPLGGDCSKNADCSIGNSTCIDFTCQCRPYFEIIYGEKCVPVLKKPCRSNCDCFNVPFAECSTNKTCACKTNYVTLENGSCLPPEIGICTKNSDCIFKNSYCYFNTCQCIRNFVGQIINGVYECKQISLGSSCETDHDCSNIKYSKCSHDKICVCLETYYALDNGFICVPGIGGYCSGDIDCAFANFRCFSSLCKCQPGYVSVSDNQCVLKSSAISCDMGIECGEHWHSDCSLDHTCFCKSNNTQVNQATCSPILGGACFKDDQCVVKNSICTSFHCRCNEAEFKAVAINMCISNCSVLAIIAFVLSDDCLLSLDRFYTIMLSREKIAKPSHTFSQSMAHSRQKFDCIENVLENKVALKLQVSASASYVSI